MNAKDLKTRQRDHYQKMKDAGMKKVSVYVPAELVDELRKYAAKLRNKIVRK